MPELGRLGQSAKSPLHPIETVVLHMKDQLLEVRKESETLLQKRLRDVLDVNLRIEKELEGVRRQLDGKSIFFPYECRLMNSF